MCCVGRKNVTTTIYARQNNQEASYAILTAQIDSQMSWNSNIQLYYTEVPNSYGSMEKDAYSGIEVKLLV